MPRLFFTSLISGLSVLVGNCCTNDVRVTSTLTFRLESGEDHTLKTKFLSKETLNWSLATTSSTVVAFSKFKPEHSFDFVLRDSSGKPVAKTKLGKKWTVDASWLARSGQVPWGLTAPIIPYGLKPQTLRRGQHISLPLFCPEEMFQIPVPGQYLLEVRIRIWSKGASAGLVTSEPATVLILKE